METGKNTDLITCSPHLVVWECAGGNILTQLMSKPTAAPHNPDIPRGLCQRPQDLQSDSEKILHRFRKRPEEVPLSPVLHGWKWPSLQAKICTRSCFRNNPSLNIPKTSSATNDPPSWAASNHKVSEVPSPTQETARSSSLLPYSLAFSRSYHCAKSRQQDVTRMWTTLLCHPTGTPHKTRPSGSLAYSLDDWKNFLQLLCAVTIYSWGFWCKYLLSSDLAIFLVPYWGFLSFLFL